MTGTTMTPPFWGVVLGCLYIALGFMLWLWMVLNGYDASAHRRMMDDPITPLVGLVVMVLLWPVIFGAACLGSLWATLRSLLTDQGEPLNTGALDNLRARYRTMPDDEIDTDWA